MEGHFMLAISNQSYGLGDLKMKTVVMKLSKPEYFHCSHVFKFYRLTKCFLWDS